MTDVKKAALGALSEISNWLLPAERSVLDRDLATIRAALQPTAVERVLDMDGEIYPACQCAACRELHGEKWKVRIGTGDSFHGPTPEAAARAALEAMERKP